MPKSHYEWDRWSPPVIGEHSLAKHRILREYVERYVQILMADPRRDLLKLTVVDGFAGGGIYQLATGGEHLGSPLILMDAVESAVAKLQRKRLKRIKVAADFVFIEKKADAHVCLESVLEEQRPGVLQSDHVKSVHGLFEEELDGVISHINSRGRKPRAIFILDQYGYSDILVDTLRSIFSRIPNAEIFMTLAVGWIVAYMNGETNAGHILRKSLGLSAAEVEDAFLREDADAARKRRTVQAVLHQTFSTKLGAQYYTPFFIHSRESNKSYWFLHLANSWRAHDEVKKLHWTMENHFRHYGDAGTMMLGFDPRKDNPDQLDLVYAFDYSAKGRTTDSLLEELPRMITDEYTDGIQLRALAQSLANQTPATESLLGEVVNKACQEQLLVKKGRDGEVRRPSTTTKPNDIIYPARQLRLPWPHSK